MTERDDLELQDVRAALEGMRRWGSRGPVFAAVACADCGAPGVVELTHRGVRRLVLCEGCARKREISDGE